MNAAIIQTLAMDVRGNRAERGRGRPVCAAFVGQWEAATSRGWEKNPSRVKAAAKGPEY
ncbi:MAG: hypothetical protein M9963_09200 [Kiritimatiellae bacterium]|nr:hypothetical protein [Kiritimatiellia bacterium]